MTSLCLELNLRNYDSTRTSTRPPSAVCCGEVKSLELNLLNYKDDHAAASKELDAVLAYQDKSHPTCSEL